MYEDGPGYLIPEKGIDQSLINQLNEIQNRLGKKVIIESGVRDYKHNLWSWAKLESDKAEALEKDHNKVFTSADHVSLNSWHMCGDAADFRIEGYDTDQEFYLLKTESDLLERKYPNGYHHAYKSSEGRDPDNYHQYPYIHADNKGSSQCSGKDVSYKEAENTVHTTTIQSNDRSATIRQTSPALELIETTYKNKKVYIININPASYDVDVITSKTATGEKVAETSKINSRIEGLAAINAGFFHTNNGDHASVIIENGITVKSKNDEDEFNAYFVAKEDGEKRAYSIVEAEDFSSKDVVSAISSISYVISHKYQFPCTIMTRPEFCPEKNKRSVIGIKDDGTISLIVADGFSIPEFGEYLAPRYKNALNMDGGGSTSMEYHFGEKDVSIKWEHQELCERRGINKPCQRRVPSALVVTELSDATE